MLKQFIIALSIFSLVACKPSSGSDTVKVSGRKIIVNNNPYLIKGICYHPVPKGSDQRDFSNLSEDLKLMLEAGINTIRVYSPIAEESVLNEIDAAGIKVIIGFGYNPKNNKTATIIDNEIPSFKVISENSFLFVSPSIAVWNIFNI